MELTTWFVYVSVISVLIFSPGPSALLCVSDGLKFGNIKAIPTVLGGAIAAMVLMSISAVGLGAILVASDTLFFIVKLLGACYLIYLGWTSWADGAVKVGSAEGIKLENVKAESNYDDSNHHQRALVGDKVLAGYSFYRLFHKGFMVGISNPKDILFFIALFPSFLNAELPQFAQFAVLAVTWFVFDCAAMFMYAGLGSNISPWLSNARNMSLVNRTVGTVFIALGSMLALSTRFDDQA